MPKAKTLMIQGTASGVGKSLITAALLRTMKKRGLSSAPFKAQNMSNNSCIASEGGEIARAQAMQAECAGLEPSVHMNPVLLKPHSDFNAQVIVQGQPVGHMDVRSYQAFQKRVFTRVRESLFRLLAQYDVVVIEGAGSPAEVNLRDHDLVNMRIARLVHSPVLLVGDIDRGGVFASLYGTYALLSPSDRRRIRGFVINKFRGDESLLNSGLRFLERKTGIPVLGVIPYMEDLFLDEEDSLGLLSGGHDAALDVAVFRCPRLSNFTDLKALELEPEVKVRTFTAREDFGEPDLVIIPGTKSTLDDLQFLRKKGLIPVLKRYASRGGTLLGICGGFQMLGESVEDALGVEGRKRKVRGLGLLPVKTFFETEKITRKVETWAEWRNNGGRMRAKVKGYEIHMGRTIGLSRMTRQATAQPALWGKANIYGTYLHGLFDNDSFRRKFLGGLERRPDARIRTASRDPLSYRVRKERSYDRIAEVVEKSVDFPFLLNLLKC